MALPTLSFPKPHLMAYREIRILDPYSSGAHQCARQLRATMATLRIQIANRKNQPGRFLRNRCPHNCIIGDCPQLCSYEGGRESCHFFEYPTISVFHGPPLAKNSNCRRFRRRVPAPAGRGYAKRLLRPLPLFMINQVIIQKSSAIRKKWQRKRPNRRNRRIFEKCGRPAPGRRDEASIRASCASGKASMRFGRMNRTLQKPCNNRPGRLLHGFCNRFFLFVLRPVAMLPPPQPGRKLCFARRFDAVDPTADLVRQGMTAVK